MYITKYDFINIGDIIMRRLNTRRVKTESIEDPRELLLSLVDMGSLDADELLLACIQEMSDAECKRVLNSLTLPSCCDDVECDDEVEDAEFEEPEDVDVEPVEPAEFEEDEEELDDEEIAEVESRIRRLEKVLSNNSCKRESIKPIRRRVSESRRFRDRMK